MTIRRRSVMSDLLIIVGGIVIAGFLYTFSAAYLSVPGKPGVTVPPQGPITLEGMVTCLPHKNARGPQTLECAFGFVDAQGLYYGLRDSDPSYSTVSSVAMQVPVRVEGVFTPRLDSRYESVGVIDVFSIMEIMNESLLSVRGVFACLPLKEVGTADTPCEIGLRTAAGKFYVLDLGPLARGMKLPQEGDLFEGVGAFIPLENISNDTWSQYSIEGIFSVTDIVGDEREGLEVQ